MNNNTGLCKFSKEFLLVGTKFSLFCGNAYLVVYLFKMISFMKSFFLGWSSCHRDLSLISMLMKSFWCWASLDLLIYFRRTPFKALYRLMRWAFSKISLTSFTTSSRNASTTYMYLLMQPNPGVASVEQYMLYMWDSDKLFFTISFCHLVYLTKVH